MQDREVGITAVFATALWVGGSAMVLLNAVNVVAGVQLGQVGLACIGGAMVLNVRGFICRMHRELRDAFQYGRDYERGHQAESLRRVH